MSNKTVLIVDDEPMILEILAVALESSGYRVASASSGKQALAVLASMACDLILTDIRMPELGGLELLEAIRKSEKPGLPVILMTGFADITPEQAILKGAYALLFKPFTLEEVENLLRKALSTCR